MEHSRITFQANCGTTAMGIMPHTDIERALGLCLDLDVPFWPQLPRVSFYEDMYVQSSQNFPGIVLDLEGETIRFSSERFAADLSDYARRMDEPETFALGPPYSAVYHRFLSRPLDGYRAVRGQITGPVSFGFKVMDEDNKPIIYNDNVKDLLYDFLQRKVNTQYRELKAKNPGAFVWMDEPGLGWVFSGLSGYNDVTAKKDYRNFLDGLEGPRALHLCANVNLPYLLELGIELLSFDAYQLETMPKGYAAAVAAFIQQAGIIAWGIVPTDATVLRQETPDSLAGRLAGYWEVVAANSPVTQAQLAAQALIAPARCCLKNVGLTGAAGETPGDGSKTCSVLSSEEQTVETAFTCLKETSLILKERFHL